jgi:transposase
MWTAADRERYGRDGLRYPSDLTDAEWASIAPLIRPAKRGGRGRSVVVREVMNGLLYVLETGCQWRHLPRDLPPRSTVHGYLRRWDWNGTLEAVHHRLYVACRERAGKEASPTAAILDSRSVKAAEKGGRRSTRSVGFDAGKKVNGRKRHIVTDTTGLLLVVLVTAASVQDRDAGRVLLSALGLCFPGVSKVWADSGYAGALVEWAHTTWRISVGIVRKLAGQTTRVPQFVGTRA